MDCCATIQALQRLGFREFDKEHSLFIDDTEGVLKTAREYGIKHLLFKATANSKTAPKESKEFTTISNFRDLMNIFLKSKQSNQTLTYLKRAKRNY